MDVPQKSLELVEIQFLYSCKAKVLKEAVQVDVFGVYLEAKFCHHHFEFVFKVLVLLSVLSKIVLENGMNKDFVPGKPILFFFLQTLPQKIFSLCWKIRVDYEWLGLDVLHKFELCMRVPRSFSMQHLIENKTSCPDIAFGSIRIWLQHLNGHVQRGSNWCLVLHPLRNIPFGKPKISYLHDSLAQHNIRRLQIPKYQQPYRCTIPSLTKAIKPLQICLRKSIASAYDNSGCIFR